MKVSDPLKRRNAPGSRCCGCPATVYCCLLTISNEQNLLEIQFPLQTAHKIMTHCHYPISYATNQL